MKSCVMWRRSSIIVRIPLRRLNFTSLEAKFGLSWMLWMLSRLLWTSSIGLVIDKRSGACRGFFLPGAVTYRPAYFLILPRAVRNWHIIFVSEKKIDLKTDKNEFKSVFIHDCLTVVLTAWLLKVMWQLFLKLSSQTFSYEYRIYTKCCSRFRIFSWLCTIHIGYLQGANILCLISS